MSLRDRLFSNGSDSGGNKVTKVEDIDATNDSKSMLSKFINGTNYGPNYTKTGGQYKPTTKPTQLRPGLHQSTIDYRADPNVAAGHSAVTQHWGSDWKKANAATNPGGSSVSNAGNAYGDAWAKRLAAAPVAPADQLLYRGGSSLADAGYDREQYELEKEFNKRFNKNWDPTVTQNDERNLAGPEFNTESLYVDAGQGDNNPDIQALIDEIANTDDGTTPSARRAIKSPTLRGADDMAALHGIDYNLENMRKYLDDSTDAQYAGLDTDFSRLKRDFYNMSSRNADDLYGAFAQGDKSAAMTDSTGGSNLAAQMMALQSSATLSSQGATELAQAHADLVQEKGAAKAENAMNAMTMYNEMGINLATMSARELEALAETYAADIGYAATIDSAQMAAQAQKYASLQNRLGLENSANAQAAANKYSSDSSKRLVNDPGWLATQLNPANE